MTNSINSSGSSVAQFYDEYSSQQKKIGVNVRHRTIFKNLLKQGLKRNSTVLEIGCGIGTLTSLIAKHVTNGKILAVDISPKSIEMARSIYKDKSNIEFFVSDMIDFKRSEKFDFIVMPDVLEHIPVEQHKNLFKILREHCHIKSIVLINIPNPPSLRWAHKNVPSLVQIVDQPLSTQELLNNVYPNDFFLFSMETYSLHMNEPDYQSIVFKPNFEFETMTKKSKISLIIQEVKSRFL